ncbi:MAG TPA: methylmalonate-semialdehyde dehydrogenase (CoA acylating), partial [Gammaproteobacteria bacterium]|nr:methylmalonate-semialdehyde dehydrogenase (CoA acylating) [Gammaproteobacteria bacterium]
CMAISVAVCVGEETADKTVALLKDKIAGLKIGPGVDAGNDMGPLITKAALDRVTHFIAKGVEEGAELAADGRGLEVAGHESGFFIGASLFDRVTSEMSIYQDEIFG